MLHLILADSELETVPSIISSDKSIQRKAQRRGRKGTELILDSNYYHKPMRKLEDSNRRGRPDIVHVCILAALDSPLNREGCLNMYIHTRNDEVINIDSETRIPRSYNRFIGLMEQLFLVGGVPPDNPLMKLERGKNLTDLVDEINADKTITFTQEGRKIGRDELFDGLGLDNDICVVIGDFPHGDFLSNVDGLSDDLVCIYSESLDAVTVVTHAIQFYEDYFLSDSIFS
ncbi:hypothetical protein AKJ49_01370 [candidate division MSBL1 archaeon SCGC-AAA382A03]|uniref:Ribosomal RNA small subunit methyltransferase Nep1 n=1 Tax=candidate division MSBL1 archaeon SCGC-AAA382A03 TaxID=1698278 RepID=A0A133VFD7_9EURY|nr:hypothetical protein AKJ49_01370 [candidate division MSBL1 archaeon SCGC-AAA382A03]